MSSPSLDKETKGLFGKQTLSNDNSIYLFSELPCSVTEFPSCLRSDNAQHHLRFAASVGLEFSLTFTDIIIKYLQSAKHIFVLRIQNGKPQVGNHLVPQESHLATNTNDNDSAIQCKSYTVLGQTLARCVASIWSWKKNFRASNNCDIALIEFSHSNDVRTYFKNIYSTRQPSFTYHLFHPAIDTNSNTARVPTKGTFRVAVKNYCFPCIISFRLCRQGSKKVEPLEFSLSSAEETFQLPDLFEPDQIIKLVLRHGSPFADCDAVYIHVIQEPVLYPYDRPLLQAFKSISPYSPPSLPSINSTTGNGVVPYPVGRAPSLPLPYSHFPVQINSPNVIMNPFLDWNNVPHRVHGSCSAPPTIYTPSASSTDHSKSSRPGPISHITNASQFTNPSGTRILSRVTAHSASALTGMSSTGKILSLDIAQGNRDQSRSVSPVLENQLVYELEKKFKSSILHQQSKGVAVVELYIRSKRRGQWQSTNIAPAKIGKMRKCVLRFFDLLANIKVHVVSSNIDVIKLSSFGRSSFDGVDKITNDIKPGEHSTFSFFIIPLKNRSSADVTISIEFVDIDPTDIVELAGDVPTPLPVRHIPLHEWKMNVAGHKFESSKAGKTQSDINMVPNIVRLFNPPLPKSGMFKEEELHLVDSLLLMRDTNTTRESRLDLPSSDDRVSSSATSEETPCHKSDDIMVMDIDEDKSSSLPSPTSSPSKVDPPINKSKSVATSFPSVDPFVIGSLELEKPFNSDELMSVSNHSNGLSNSSSLKPRVMDDKSFLGGSLIPSLHASPVPYFS